MYSLYKNDINKANYALKQLNRKVYKDIEYIVQGNGVPVLVIHGICGGCDQSLIMGRQMLGDNAKVVALSRYGYLNSNCPKDSTPENQANHYIKLLDYLGIDKVFVIAASAGGSSAIQLVLNYEERIKGLILVGPNAPNDEKIKGLTGPPIFLVRNFIFWLLIKTKLPLLAMFGIKRKQYKKAKQSEKKEFNKLMKTLLPVNLRKQGVINDSRVTNVDFETHQYPFHKINIKTLILQAKNDPLAKYGCVKNMADKIKDAVFVEYTDGGHLLFGHKEDVNTRINQFIGGIQ